MSTHTSEPIVEEVVRFEDLPFGSAGTRRAVVRWSDGTEDAPLTWYGDEILVCEGDLFPPLSRTRQRNCLTSLGVEQRLADSPQPCLAPR